MVKVVFGAPFPDVDTAVLIAGFTVAVTDAVLCNDVFASVVFVSNVVIFEL